MEIRRNYVKSIHITSPFKWGGATVIKSQEDFDSLCGTTLSGLIIFDGDFTLDLSTCKKVLGYSGRPVFTSKGAVIIFAGGSKITLVGACETACNYLVYPYMSSPNSTNENATTIINPHICFHETGFSNRFTLFYDCKLFGGLIWADYNSMGGMTYYSPVMDGSYDFTVVSGSCVFSTVINFQINYTNATSSADVVGIYDSSVSGANISVTVKSSSGTTAKINVYAMESCNVDGATKTSIASKDCTAVFGEGVALKVKTLEYL